jgi:hypothetical protein
MGTAQVEHPMARHDEGAIDDTGHDWGDLTSGDRDHCLVKQPHTLRTPPELDQRLALV